MNDLRIAAVCICSVPGDIEGNLDRIGHMASVAVRGGADIACFPEFAATGYALEDPEKYCSAKDTKMIMDRLAQMGRDMGLVLIVGLIEHADEKKPYIAQVIAGPKGLVGIYRKTHLSPTEKGVYSPGEKLEVFTYGGWTFGVQLCYEAHFPDISTTMALAGADILFFPHASPRGDPEEKMKSWLRHLPARAFDNGVFIAACNQAGKNGAGLSFPGVALVLGPDGRLLERIQEKGETILFAVLKGEALQNIRQHRMKYFLSERRPELYR